MKWEMDKRKGQWSPKTEPVDTEPTPRQYDFISKKLHRIVNEKYAHDKQYEVKRRRDSIIISIKGVKHRYEIDVMNINTYFRYVQNHLGASAVPEFRWRAMYLQPQMNRFIETMIQESDNNADWRESTHRTYADKEHDLANYKKKLVIEKMKEINED